MIQDDEAEFESLPYADQVATADAQHFANFTNRQFPNADWDKFVKNQRPSTNIEDRRGEDEIGNLIQQIEEKR